MTDSTAHTLTETAVSAPSSNAPHASARQRAQAARPAPDAQADNSALAGNALLPLAAMVSATYTREMQRLALIRAAAAQRKRAQS